MEAVHSSEKSKNIYKITWRHILQDGNLQVPQWEPQIWEHITFKYLNA
jgi:hypothetical protein